MGAVRHGGPDSACGEVHFVNGRAAVVCQSDGERRIRLFSVSRMRLSAEKRVVRMGWLGRRVAGLCSRRRNRTLAVERICGRKKDCLEKARCGAAGLEATKRTRKVVGRRLMFTVIPQLLRGRPEKKRRRGKHREQSKECGFAGGSVAHGSPKKKERVERISSRDGATAIQTGD